MLKHADRYRQIAAIGEFKSILQHQARKRHARLLDGEAAYSTITCFTCGARAEGGAALVLQCPNGHKFDQDENAAKWFLARIGQEGRITLNLRPRPASLVPQRVEVPVYLKSMMA
ncbi:MAG: transposase [Acidobacteria bacterium]|nr:transposase [Acidobacteriota bacterium]